MRRIRLDQFLYVAALLTLATPTRAALVFFSWWDSRYATPGIISDARGGYTRDARLPEEEADIHVLATDFSTKTNPAVALVRVFPPGSDLVDANAFTARSQTDFGQNHAATRTLPTSVGESADKQFFDNRSHSMITESLWIDHWTFSGTGLGSSAVSLSAGLDATISNSPCPTCGQVNHPALIKRFRPWWYRLSGSIRVFDLDIIDRLFQPDSDFYPDVPRQVAAFEVFQQGANQDIASFGSLEPYDDVPNARLTPVHTNGVASFVPVSGHRYAVVGRIQIQSREGADVDAGHTLSLDQVLLGPGLRLNSVALTSGAHFNLRTATPLSLTQTAPQQVMLSFPSTSGFTYSVEFTSALGAAPWIPLTTRPGSGSIENVTDTLPDSAPRFYRLRVQ